MNTKTYIEKFTANTEVFIFATDWKVAMGIIDAKEKPNKPVYRGAVGNIPESILDGSIVTLEYFNEALSLTVLRVSEDKLNPERTFNSIGIEELHQKFLQGREEFYNENHSS